MWIHVADDLSHVGHFSNRSYVEDVKLLGSVDELPHSDALVSFDVPDGFVSRGARLFQELRIQIFDTNISFIVPLNQSTCERL